MLTFFFAGALGESARIAGAPCALLPGSLYRDLLLTTNIMYFNLKPKVADWVVIKVSDVISTALAKRMWVSGLGRSGIKGVIGRLAVYAS